MIFRSLMFAMLAAALAVTSASAQTTFTVQHAPYATSDQAVALTTGDFNRDGWPDIALLRQTDEVQIFVQNSAGEFSLASSFAVGDSPRHIVTADFNRDGDLDLAVLRNNPGYFEIWRGGSGSTFTKSRTYSVPGHGRAIATGDLNRDRVGDLVVAVCSSGSSVCSFEVWISNRDMSFSMTQSVTTPGSVHIGSNGLEIADLNRDSRNDLVVGAGKVYLYGGTGSGTVQYKSSIAPPDTFAISDVAVGTLNSGTTLDLLVRGNNRGNPDCCFTAYAHAYVNSGGWSYTRKQTFTLNYITEGEGAITDLNGDRKMDVLFIDHGVFGGRLRYGYGRGDGTFEALQSAIEPGESPSGLIVRDFNRDSRHEFAISMSIDGLAIYTNTNARQGCPAPSSATQTARICLARWSTDRISVHASGNAPAGVKRLEVWIDGSKKYQTYNDQLRAGFKGLSSGTHRVTVQVVDLFDVTGKSTVYVTVP